MIIVLVTASPGAGWYYFDPGDETVEIANSDMTGPLVAGTVLNHLPDGAKAVMIEKRQYFVSSGNWFVAVYDTDTIHYMVVLAPV